METADRAAAGSVILSEKAKALLLRHEGYTGRPYWPGGNSGVTLDYGYDLAHHSAAELWADWAGHLKPDQLKRLQTVIGFTGEAAHRMIVGLRDIRVTREAAIAVFEKSSAPKYWSLTAGAFPGIESLPADAQGALFSLVYNRGPGLSGERRAEMRAIRTLVAKGDLKGIAAELRAMKRLWAGKGLPGLLARREDEAVLVEAAT